MSVIVETPEHEYHILTKGAPEAVFAHCTQFESEGEILPMEPILIGDLIQEYNDLSADGFRVLAVAYRNLDKRAAYSKADESELILKGYIAFLDPPKETAGQAIAALQHNGVRVKVLTGDNDLVTRKVCKDVGLDTGEVLLGSAVESHERPAALPGGGNDPGLRAPFPNPQAAHRRGPPPQRPRRRLHGRRHQ